MTSVEPDLPAHVEETIGTIDRLHEEHRRAASGLQRTSEWITAFLSRPRFILMMSAIVAAWLVAHWGARLIFGRVLDPSLQGLQTLTAVVALYVAVFILATQRRDDQLAELREKLTLELAILSEQKIAKVIALLEELRRDLPSAPNRGDPEAEALASPADTAAVVEALRDPAGDSQAGT